VSVLGAQPAVLLALPLPLLPTLFCQAKLAPATDLCGLCVQCEMQKDQLEVGEAGQRQESLARAAFAAGLPLPHLPPPMLAAATACKGVPKENG